MYIGKMYASYTTEITCQINSDVIVNSHVCHSCFVNSYRRVFQRFLLGCNWNPFQTIQLVLIWSWLVFVLVWLTYFDYNLLCSFPLPASVFYTLWVRKNICPHTQIYMCVCVSMYIIYIYVCVCIYMCICMLCVCICVYMFMCKCMYVYVCIYIYVYIYIYVCVCVYYKKGIYIVG